MNEHEQPSYPAIRTHVEHIEGQDLSGGHQAVHVTVALNAENPVELLLPRDYGRLESRIMSIARPGGSVTADIIESEPVVDTPFFFCTVPYAGYYNVEWSIWVGGTLAAVDANNMDLITSAVSNNFVAQGFFPATAGIYPQQSLSGIYVPTSQYGTYLAVQPSPNSPTSGAIYAAQVVAIPAGAPVVLGQSKEIAEFAASQAGGYAGPAGSLLQPGTERTLRNCDELWVAWTGVPALVSAISSRRLPANPG